MEETLEFIKETKKTYVYGNDTIQSLYLPKEEFDGECPDEIFVHITW